MAVKIEHKFQMTGTENVSGSLNKMTEASKKAAKAAADGSKATASWQGTVTALSTATLAGIAAVNGIASAIQGFVAGAIEGDAATNRLGKSLKLFGGYSDAAMASLGSFADELELLTGFSAESATEALSLGKSLGLTNDQAMDLTQTAAALAKGTGKDLSSAMQELAATFDGSAGRLAKLIPEMRGLTEEQLRAGGAVGVLDAKFRGFLQGGQSMEDSLKRIANSFAQTNDAAADSFLAGFDVGKLADDLQSSFSAIGAALQANAGNLEFLGSGAADAIRELASPAFWVPVINRFGAVVEAIRTSGLAEAIKDTFKGIVAFVSVALKGIEAGIRAIVGPIKYVSDLLTTGFAGANANGKAAFDEIAMLGASITSDFAVVTDGIGSLMAGTALLPDVVGKYDEAYARLAATTAANQGGKGKSKAGTRDASKFGIKPSGDAKAAEKASLDAAAAILDTLAIVQAAQAQGTEAFVAQQADALKRVAENRMKTSGELAANDSFWAAQEAAVREAFTRQASESYELYLIGRGAAAERGIAREKAALESLAQAGIFSQEQVAAIVKAKESERVKVVTDSLTKITAANGTRVEQIRAQYDEDLANYKKMLEEKGLADSEYFAKYKEQRDKALQKDLSKESDAKIAKVGSLVSSATQGVNSLIQNIGSMFGPIGAIIGQVVSFLNQSPEQFSQTIKGLIDAAMQLVPNLMANIPELIFQAIMSIPGSIKQAIETSLSGLPTLVLGLLSAAIMALGDIIPEMLNPTFWFGIARDAFKAFVKAFQNFWSVLFTGKGIKEELDKQAAAPSSTARFGTQDANAGENKFQVKDLQETATAVTFEDRVKTATEESGKGFFGYMKEAWQWVIDNVFAPLGKWVAEAFEPIKQLGLSIWNSFVAAFQGGLETLKGVGKAIWNGLADMFTISWDTFKKAGGQIWDGLKALFSGEFGKAGNLFLQAGKTLWEGAVALMKSGWNVFKDAGVAIWNGLKTMFDGATGVLKTMGSQIWNGLTTAWNSGLALIKGIGSNIWEGLKAALNGGKSIFSNLGKWIWESLKSLMGGGGGGGGGGSTALAVATGGISKALGLNSGGIVPSSGSNPALASAFVAAGAQRFQSGGSVLGSDTVPAVLTPGETVLNRAQTNALRSGALTIGGNGGGGGPNVNVTVNYSGGGDFDRRSLEERLTKMIMSSILEASRNGTRVVAPQGVY